MNRSITSTPTFPNVWGAAAGESLVMSNTSANPKRIRTGQVLKLTGWNRAYLDKLVARGIVKAWYLYPGSWAWYDEREILELLNGRATTPNHE